MELISTEHYSFLNWYQQQEINSDITSEIVDVVSSINHLIASKDVDTEYYEEIITTVLKEIVMVGTDIEWYRRQRDNLLVLKGVEAELNDVD